MTIREENMDLFAVPQGYYLAHCITEDFSLGAGIAKKMDEVFNMREKLINWYDSIPFKDTEETYGLDWNRVREIIEEVFDDTDIEILICSLKGRR